MSCQKQLKTVLREHGVSPKQFYYEVTKEYAIEAWVIQKACLYTERNGKTPLWKKRWKYIDRALERLGIVW